MMDELNDLPRLDEDAIVDALEKRFENDKPYTSAVGMCIAVNPYVRLEQLYARETQSAYVESLLCDAETNGDRGKDLGPHLYRTSCASYKDMCARRRSQSILVSGESGAGKTESTKILMDHLAHISLEVGGPAATANKRTVERILQSNPLLEAFGNAKTIRNDNSSRFGKFIALRFDDRDLLAGAALSTYLLEKSRLTHQGHGERAFHVLYQLVNGGLDEEFAAANFQENDPPLRCLCNNTDIDRDKVQGATTRAALRAIGLGDGTNFKGILDILAAVVFLLELEFAAPDDQDGQGSAAARAGRACTDALVPRLVRALTGQEDSWADLETALTHRQIKVGSETIAKPLDAPAARANAQALAKALYAALFDWLVERINASLGGNKENASLRESKPDAESAPTIEILDIFGFECFEKNSLEQLCINLTNERLQQVFNESVLRQVQLEYEREGVPWTHIEHNDGAETIALIQGKAASVFGLLHEESVRPNGSDHALVAKLTADASRSHLLRRDRFDKHVFSIEHFAGTVTYDAHNFVEINLDALSDGLAAFVRDQGSYFAQSIWPAAPAIAARAGKAAAARTLTFKFRSQLDDLIEAIAATNTHFVRCIKPNTSMRHDIFDRDMVRTQLRCSGVVEAIRISRAGYADRLLHEDVLREMGPGLAADLAALLALFLEPHEYCVGETRVYFVRGALHEMRARHARLLEERAVRIQALARRFLGRVLAARLRAVRRLRHAVRGFLARCRFCKVREGLVRLQASIRTRRARRAFIRVVKAAQALQRMGRRRIARNAHRARAAAQLQKWGRMHLRRREYSVCKRGAVRMQARVRMIMARRSFRERLAAYRESQSIGNLQAEVRALKARIAEMEKSQSARGDQTGSESISAHDDDAAGFSRKDWVPVATARKLRTALVRLSRENARLKSLLQDQDQQLTQLRLPKRSRGGPLGNVSRGAADRENQFANANRSGPGTAARRDAEAGAATEVGGGPGSFILKGIVSSGESFLRTMEGVGKFLLEEVDPLEFDAHRSAQRGNQPQAERRARTASRNSQH